MQCLGGLKTRTLPAPVGVFVLALTVRLVYLSEMQHSPTFDSPIMDAAYHDQWARRIAAGDWLGSEVFFRAPLYPYFLGVIYSIFGHSFLAARLIQFTLGATTCVLIYLLGRRVGGVAVGLVAGVAAALYGPMIYFEGELLLPVLEMFFATAMLLALASGLDREHCGPSTSQGSDASSAADGALAESQTACTLPWVLTGLSLGLFAITRPNILAFLPLLLLYLPFQLGLARGARAGALVTLAAALCILPVTVRNYVVGKDFVLISSQGGVNFYIGNNPASDGVTAVVPGTRPTWWGGYRDTITIAEREAGRKLRPSEISALWTRKAMAFIRGAPSRWLQSLARRAVLFWNAFELSNNQQVYMAARDSRLLGVLVWKTRWLAFPFGILGPVALVGLGLAIVRREIRLMPIVLFVLAYSASVVAFFICSRFRMPCIPALLVLGAWAAQQFADALRERRRMVVAVMAWTCLLLAAFVNFDFYGTWRVDEAKAHLDDAVALQQKGRCAEAETEFRRAFELGPDRPENALGLAICLLARGKPQEARPLLERVLKVDRHRWEALVGMGDVLAQQGKLEQAISYYKRAIRVDPRGTEAFLRLGDVYRKLGHDEDAARAYAEGIGREGDEALRLALAQVYFDHGRFDQVETLCQGLIDQGFFYTKARVLLGSAYVNTGEFEKAHTLAKQVLVVDPDNAEALVVLGSCLMKRGEVREAIESLRRATELVPSLAEAWTNLAAAYAVKGDLSAALDAADRALKLDPNSPEARFVKAGCYYDRGEKQKAIAECKRILQGGYYAPARDLLDRCRQVDSR